jgi:hypothetical protein
MRPGRGHSTTRTTYAQQQAKRARRQPQLLMRSHPQRTRLQSPRHAKGHAQHDPHQPRGHPRGGTQPCARLPPHGRRDGVKGAGGYSPLSAHARGACVAARPAVARDSHGFVVAHGGGSSSITVHAVCRTTRPAATRDDSCRPDIPCAYQAYSNSAQAQGRPCWHLHGLHGPPLYLSIPRAGMTRHASPAASAGGFFRKARRSDLSCDVPPAGPASRSQGRDGASRGTLTAGSRGGGSWRA